MNPAPGGRSSRRRTGQRPEGLLHHLAAVLSLAAPRAASGSGSPPASSAQRRRRQHVALAQRLLDPLPAGLRPADPGPERFWQALRWGGGGLLIAWVLGR